LDHFRSTKSPTGTPELLEMWMQQGLDTLGATECLGLLQFLFQSPQRK